MQCSSDSCRDNNPQSRAFRLELHAHNAVIQQLAEIRVILLLSLSQRVEFLLEVIVS